MFFPFVIIFSNIIISAPNLTVDEAWVAAEIANIADDIRDMPMGMKTVISEGQGSISGGQKQRIMIARAIVHKPRILIFDEATSALDPVVEKKIMDNIKRRGCTCVIVAHRLSAIRDCDQIIVMNRGKIVQRGSHDELAYVDGHYKRFISNL